MANWPPPPPPRSSAGAASGWSRSRSRRPTPGARRQDVIEEGLARTDARLAADLTAALTSLRDSATELLGLELAVPDPSGRLAGDRRCFYTTADEAGQTELLAGAMAQVQMGEQVRLQRIIGGDA